MAHTCPDCGSYCTCNGDWDDIDLGEVDYCECCLGSEDDDDVDFQDESIDQADELPDVPRVLSNSNLSDASDSPERAS